MADDRRAPQVKSFTVTVVMIPRTQGGVVETVDVMKSRRHLGQVDRSTLASRGGGHLGQVDRSAQCHLFGWCNELWR